MVNIAKNIFGDITQEELYEHQKNLLNDIYSFDYFENEKYCDIPTWTTFVGTPLEVVIAKEILRKLTTQYTAWNGSTIERWEHHECHPYDDGSNWTMKRALVAATHTYDWDTGTYIEEDPPQWIAIDLDLLRDHGLVLADVNDDDNNYRLTGFLPLDQLLALQAKRPKYLHDLTPGIADPIDEFDD